MLVPEFYEVQLFSDTERPAGGYRDYSKLRIRLRDNHVEKPHVTLAPGGDLGRILDSENSLEAQTKSLAALFRAYADRLDEMAPNLIAGDWK